MVSPHSLLWILRVAGLVPGGRWAVGTGQAASEGDVASSGIRSVELGEKKCGGHTVQYTEMDT